MDPRSLSEPAACVDEALHVYRTSTTAWETASSYYRAVDSPRSHRHEISDPGIRHHSCQPLPQAFTSQYTNVQFKSFMGLFPQINRAWLTVDSNLFLWAYTPVAASPLTSDFYVYEGFSQIIVSVALITPRPGVFVETVRYLLAVATPIEVTLLGVTFSPSGQLSLVPTQISIPTDNTLMLKILSADDGRIFMAGADGGLHQFVYAPNNSSSLFDLFSSRPRKRARKIAHSSSSIASYLIPASVKSWFSAQNEIVDLAVEGNALYTLSQTGFLSVYDISTNSVSAVASSEIASDAKHLFTYSMPPGEREFVSIHPIPTPWSAVVQLIVVTSYAERIYYSTRSSSVASSYTPAARPKTLRCVAYRPSPEAEMSRSAPRPCIHIAWCHRGAAIFADLKENQSDRLLCVYPDANISSTSVGRSDGSLNTPRSSEIVIATSLESSSQDYNYASLPPNTPASHSTFNNAQVIPNTPIRTFAIAEVDVAPSTSPEIAPSSDPPNLFWVLTSTAVHLYERVNPVDKLRDILSSGDENSPIVTNFFERYGPAESCAMCLEIAISDRSLSRAAGTVFYASGGEPANQRRRGNTGSRRRGGSDENSGGHFDVGRAALQSAPLARFSGAHDGITIYLAKILNPIWNNYLTVERDPDAYQALADSKEVLGSVRDRLLAVVSFLDRYSPDDMLPKSKGGSGDVDREELDGIEARGTNRRSTSARELEGGQRDGIVNGLYQLKRTDEARRIEGTAIMALKNLAIRSAEALALLLIVSDHQLHRLAVAMQAESRRKLVVARMSELVVSDRGGIVASSLIEAIFSSYADGAVAVSSVGRMLQERCGSYFGDSDVELHRGLALLRQAADSVSNRTEAGNPSHWMNGDGHNGLGLGMDSANDNSVWSSALRKSDEASLVLKAVAGRIFDIDAICSDFRTLRAIPSLVDVALTIAREAEVANTPDRAKIAYDNVLEALRPLVSGYNSRPERDGNECSEELTQLRKASLHVALNNKSEVFLQRLYDFLKETKAGEDLLLKHSSPSVENYLIRNEALEALWKYYTQHDRNFDAGTVLLKLAETGQKALVDRLNFLSCALLSLRTASSRGDDRASHLLGEVTDFLDVAKVQLRIREELKRRREASEEVDIAVKELDEEMLNLSCLFNKYARRFCLQEACLECLRCGGYRDDGYVRQLWGEILEREAETSGSASALRLRLEAIGREFYPSEVVFPTNFLIHLLEKFFCESKKRSGTVRESGQGDGQVDGELNWKGDVNWVISVLQNIGVSLSDLADGYRRLLESQQSGGVFDESWSWTEQHAQVHLLQVTELVISQWIDQLDGEGKTIGRRMISEGDKAMRVVQVCKTRLRGMNRSVSNELWQKFEALERRTASISQ